MSSLRQGDLRLLETDVAQRLLVSGELARFAYIARDGTPRVVPMMFHWNGTDLVLCTFSWNMKVAALKANPAVAITIDTSMVRPDVLLVRGRAELTEVDGIVPEYELANKRYLGEEAGTARLADVAAKPGLRMVRIAVRPAWVGVLDFINYFPVGAQTAEEFHSFHFRVA